ncbi:flagellar hook-basal body complex protein FliE [Sporosarcina gallistercoris]|uniref:flagellar hook-basal body complex protein FliE n=1 Tax=Sporosarcina gallistercoris TaxID=2762245 RepID=UPI003D2B796E
MAISSILAMAPGISTDATKTSPTTFDSQQKFGSFLKDAIQDVNAAQVQSDVMTEKLVRGDNVDLHNVMITAQKASVALSATMEVRNKVIEAYQEVMRMPV